jgi:hypothetical protein
MQVEAWLILSLVIHDSPLWHSPSWAGFSTERIKQHLQQLQPDIILLEGPVEAEAILPFAANPAMKPPVAVLVYGSVAEEAEPRAAFFPFAEFSPEWQAIQYGLQRDLPVRFIDLPQAYNLADNWQTPSPSASLLPLPEGEGWG